MVTFDLNGIVINPPCLVIVILSIIIIALVIKDLDYKQVLGIIAVTLGIWLFILTYAQIDIFHVIGEFITDKWNEFYDWFMQGYVINFDPPGSYYKIIDDKSIDVGQKTLKYIGGVIYGN